MVYKPFDLTGKVALVTGGNRGIGYGMSEALAASNAHVAIWCRDASSAEDVVKELQGLGTGDVTAFSVDVTNEQAVIDGIALTNAWKGRIDSVFANAGVSARGIPFIEQDTETYRKVMSVNLDGAYWTLREATRNMVERAKAGDWRLCARARDPCRACGWQWADNVARSDYTGAGGRADGVPQQ